MDLLNLSATCFAWISALESLRNLCSGAVYLAQLVIVTYQFSRYINALRVQQLVLLMNAVDEQLFSLCSASASTAATSQSQAQALLDTRAELEDLLELLEASGQNPLWMLSHGSRFDGLLADFERLLISRRALAANNC